MLIYAHNLKQDVNQESSTISANHHLSYFQSNHVVTILAFI